MSSKAEVANDIAQELLKTYHAYELANMLGISRETVRRRLRQSDWKKAEIHLLVDINQKQNT